MHAAVNRFVVFENETFSLLNTELGPGHTGLEVGQPFHYRGSQPQMWMINPPIPLRWWHRRRGGGRMEQWNKNKWTLINRCIIRSRVFGGQPSSWNSDKWSAVKNVGFALLLLHWSSTCSVSVVCQTSSSSNTAWRVKGESGLHLSCKLQVNTAVL